MYFLVHIMNMENIMATKGKQIYNVESNNKSKHFKEYAPVPFNNLWKKQEKSFEKEQDEYFVT